MYQQGETVHSGHGDGRSVARTPDVFRGRLAAAGVFADHAQEEGGV